jgi:hypothetical protein
MNSEGIFQEEPVETDQVEVDDNGKKSSKVAPDTKETSKKHTKEYIEERKEHTSNLSEIFSLERQFFTNENEKDILLEESKDGKQISKTSSQESEDTVITKDKATAKAKNISDKEDESKEEKIIRPSRKVEQPFSQVDECYYLKLKHGDKLEFQESSYNLNSDNLFIGSKVRLAIGRDIINKVRSDHVFDVPREEETNSFKYSDIFMIVDAIILPPLDEMSKLWNEERDLYEPIFGHELKGLIFHYPSFRDEGKRMCGNLILDRWVEDKLFLDRLIWHYRNVKASDYGFTLYEVKDGQLVKPIDYYIDEKHLDYKHKLDFTLKEHVTERHEDKKVMEFNYQSCFRDTSDDRI